jgi:6-phosphogluconolactonase
MSEPVIKIYENSLDLAAGCAGEFYSTVKSYTDISKSINIAVSGGNTPKILFDSIAENFGNKIKWDNVNLFWVDERCVPPDDIESNYGMTKRYLLDKIKISPDNVHRIKGEEDPESEADRYSKEILKFVPAQKEIPRFDLILLGVGPDGHTASLFPDHIEPLNLDEICKVSVQPITGQKRITLTETAINNSVLIYFLVSGGDKAKVVSQVLLRYPEAGGYPAFHINPTNGQVNWFLDKEAASLLN